MPGVHDELELLRAILETQHAIRAADLDLEGLLSVVVERSRTLTGADATAVELLSGDQLVLRAGSGLAVLSGLPARCVAGRQALRCDDVETDERVDRGACRRVGKRSMIVVPLLLPVSGECVGTLEAQSSEVAAFDDHAFELLDAMGDLIANALRRAQDVAELEEEAQRDGLTGLANRRHLLDRLAVALARASHPGSEQAVTVLLLDLDGFKQVNDTLGHRAGDQVLRAVGRAVAAAVRPTDTVGRLAADQFVVVCEGVPAAHTANLVTRVRRTVATAWPGPLPVTACVGVTRSAAGDSAEALLATADIAMDELKQARTG